MKPKLKSLDDNAHTMPGVPMYFFFTVREN